MSQVAHRRSSICDGMHHNATWRPLPRAIDPVSIARGHRPTVNAIMQQRMVIGFDDVGDAIFGSHLRRFVDAVKDG